MEICAENAGRGGYGIISLLRDARAAILKRCKCKGGEAASAVKIRTEMTVAYVALDGLGQPASDPVL